MWVRRSTKILKVENEHIYQIFITPRSTLKFLMNFSGDDPLIVEITPTKFHEKIHPEMEGPSFA